jgi:hypothetical protein
MERRMHYCEPTLPLRMLQSGETWQLQQLKATTTVARRGEQWHCKACALQTGPGGGRWAWREECRERTIEYRGAEVAWQSR